MMSHLRHALAHLQHADAADLHDMDRDERRRAADLLKTWLYVIKQLDIEQRLDSIGEQMTRLPDSSAVARPRANGRFKSGVLAALQDGERAS